MACGIERHLRVRACGRTHSSALRPRPPTARIRAASAPRAALRIAARILAHGAHRDHGRVARWRAARSNKSACPAGFGSSNASRRMSSGTACSARADEFRRLRRQPQRLGHAVPGLARRQPLDRFRGRSGGELRAALLLPGGDDLGAHGLQAASAAAACDRSRAARRRALSRLRRWNSSARRAHRR